MTKVIIYNDDVEYYYNGKLHRTDGPAVERFDGKRKEWYLNGKLHREDGPAIVGFIHDIWYFDGVRVIYNEKLNENNYINNYFHREDGPAITYKNGYKEYWQHGNLHREDGPAVECIDGLPDKVEYWFCDVRYSKAEYYELLKLDVPIKD